MSVAVGGANSGDRPGGLLEEEEIVEIGNIDFGDRPGTITRKLYDMLRDIQMCPGGGDRALQQEYNRWVRVVEP